MSLTRYKVVADMATAISTSTEYEDVLQVVAEQAAKAFEVFECDIYEYDGGSTAVAVALWSMDRTSIDDDYLGTRVELDTYPAMARSLREAKSIETKVNDPSLLIIDRRLLEEWDEKSTLWTPLVFGAEVIGCLELIEKRYVRPFTDYDFEFADTVAALAAMAIHTARTRRRLELQERNLRVLLTASREIAGASDDREILESIARTTGDVLQADACYVSTYRPDLDATVCHVVWEPEGHEAPGSDEIDVVYPLDESPDDRRSLETGEVIEQRLSDPDLSPQVRANLESWKLQAMLIVPTMYEGRAIGLLEIAQIDGDRHFSPDDIDLARSLADQAASAIMRRRRDGQGDAQAAAISDERIDAQGDEERQAALPSS